ncbi:hypothetical protein U1Q18_023110 [Sarracenia purpurea var. burkii]
MALSFYSNWGTLGHLKPETSSLPQEEQPELAMELLGFPDNFFGTPDTFMDDPLLFDPDDLFLPENYLHLLPWLSPPHDNSLSLSSELFIPQEFESYNYPKRQKIYEDPYYSDFTPGLIDGFIPNPPLLPGFSPGLPAPLPDFCIPPGCNAGTVELLKKPNGESASAQSIAARQRRRKITEKTQELGKLIPGGQKLNTAEMFLAAFKYIKFLQAQVGVLEFMTSIQDNEEALHTQELQVLASSPRIQEKLYSSEKCLVPSRFVQTLANDPQLQSNSLISKDLHQLIQTSG